ncbi:NUDIX domain-containing protein [Pseudoflavitalea sp. G-6-1-2]|uniref:NUDIX domain-containing protein n=1 Tax=Pseudoflavitalea sp. G-6-1-2 TaxID=2728841 RepID=UPI00146D7942|nr:NUDIX domain-containing protein [Pseudoflavitalea sp. G-6-1-2]NML20257.1 NUDIX domain-containing protein [Pseudoflavitalea sp. G-6-1-2]
MKTTGVIIARFQTPYLHEGHKFLINEIKGRHNKMVIVLGVSPVKGSRRNPFDFYTREKLLKQFEPELVVLPLRDNASDQVWSQQLDALLTSTFSMEQFVLYGSRDSFIQYYSGQFAVEELPEKGNYSASDIREENGDKVLSSVDFRLGINYAYHGMYPKVYATVDVAVLNEDNSEVLLGKKHLAAQWRFPGGFTDPEDESFEAAAKRELSEECGPIEVSEMQFVGSAKIDDWRYRNETDKIITSFFKTTLVYGKPHAADDLAELSWFPVNELQGMIEKNQITPEHHVLIQQLLKNIGQSK